MPVRDCSEGGKPGRKWGQKGKCFLYTSGSEKGRNRATQLATRQGLAIGEIRRTDAKRSSQKILETPAAFENEYRARLRKRTREMNNFLKARVLAGEMSVTTARSAQKLWARRNSPSHSWLSGFANRLGASATARTDIVIGRVGRINVGILPSGESATAINAAFVRDNVKLIRSIDTRYFEDVVRVIGDGVRGGQAPKEISKALQQRFNVSQSRADLIARDQTSKFNGQISRFRQQEVGVTKFEWQTSEDDRVREEHVALNGKVFSWASPPAEGVPGEPINCRCVGLPVMDF